MAKLEEALNFLKSDLDNAEKQWEEGKQWESLLQREGKNFDDLWEKFDPKEDESKWIAEYNGERKAAKLQLYAKRMSFLKASRKEFREEYDEKVTDVDFMRLLELPYTDPRYVIEYGLEEMKE